MYGNTKPFELADLDGEVSVMMITDPFDGVEKATSMPFEVDADNTTLIHDSYSNLGITGVELKLAISDMYEVEHEVMPAPAPTPSPEPSPAPAPVGTQEMYRLYNPNSGEHFYTSNKAERDNVISAGWTYEGIGWVAPTDGAPVYRLYNEFGGEHHFTTSKNEHDVLVDLGWKDEGIGWRTAGTDGVPVYRQYNPNAFANNHNFTVSANERNTLIGLGWKDEGIAWYGMR